MGDTIEQTQKELVSIFTNFLSPKSTRLHRNYTDCADWYWVSKKEGWI